MAKYGYIIQLYDGLGMRHAHQQCVIDYVVFSVAEMCGAHVYCPTLGVTQ